MDGFLPTVHLGAAVRLAATLGRLGAPVGRLAGG